jgi:ATP-binding cassette subfamily B protein
LRAVAAFGVLWALALAAEPLVLARMFDEIAGSGSAGVLIACLTGWVALALVSAFAIRCRDRLAAVVAADVSRDLRIKLADRELHALGPCEGLEVTAVSGVEGVNSILYPVLPSLASGVAALSAGALAAWVLDWRVALVVVAAVGPIAWLNARLSTRLQRATAAYTEGVKRLAAETRRLFNPAGRELAATMRARAHVMSRTESIAGDLRDADEGRHIAGNYWPATKIVGTLLGVAIVGVAYLLSGVSLGTTVGFVTLSLHQVDQMLTLVKWLGSFASQISHIEMVVDALDVPIERDGGQRLAAPQGRLELDAVSATYPDGRPGLNGLTLTIEPGEAVALVGKSGAGKTTVTRLATGSEDLKFQAGRALLDGVSLERLELDFLRETIVRVPQTTWVFAATVTENLLPPPGATPEDVEWACRLALLHNEITAWPDGYGTKIDSGSVSGGQAQRLGVARALLRVRLGGARLLLLDEATAALDPEAGEQQLEGVLSYLAGAGIGALVITHKLPVHPRVMRVVVITEGQAIEDGDPRELAADPSSAYARLLAVRDDAAGT